MRSNGFRKSCLLYQITACATLLAGSVASSLAAPFLTTLHTFNGADGEGPATPLAQAPDGTLYGGTAHGGSNYTNPGTGNGTVFSITQMGGFSLLATFQNMPYAQGNVVATPDDTAFGTVTISGGDGPGEIYKIAPDGTVSTFIAFTQSSPMGSNPAALAIGSDSFIYGVAEQGGAKDYGVIFRFSPSDPSSYTDLYDFTGPDGIQPNWLTSRSDGTIAGTTLYGGASKKGGYGTVFKFDPSTGVLTVLHKFGDAQDGQRPNGCTSLPAGTIYGTTPGSNTRSATIFEVSPSDKFSTVYTFPVQTDIRAPLLYAKDGNLYGTTLGRDSSTSDTIFQLTPSNTYTPILQFDDPGTFGEQSELTQGLDGNLYGVSNGDDNHNLGTVFRLTTTPVINHISPASGPVGTTVTLTGHNYSTASLVKFGTTTVPFTIVSDTEIKLVVPTGAATSKIRVTNPFATRIAGRAFTVTH